MPKVPYPYEVNGKLVTGNGSLIPICSLSNSSLMPSLTVYPKFSHILGPIRIGIQIQMHNKERENSFKATPSYRE